MLFKSTLESIRIQPSSLEAVHFKEKLFDSILQRTKKQINDSTVSIFLWSPDLPEDYIPYINNFIKYLYTLGIDVIYSQDIFQETPDQENEHQHQSLHNVLSDLKNKGRDFDLFFAIIPEKTPDRNPKIEELWKLPESINKKLFIFTEEQFAKNAKEKYNLEFDSHFCNTEYCVFPEGLKDKSFIKDLSAFLKAIQTAKFIQNSIQKNNGHNGNGNGKLLSIYDNFYKEIEIFQNEYSYLFLLTFLSNLKATSLGVLRKHFHQTPQDIQTGLINLKTFGYLRNDHKDPEKIIVTDNGYHFFKLFEIFELDSRPLLRDDKKLFKARWRSAIQATCRMTTCLFDHVDELKKLTNELYFSMATSNPQFRQYKHTLKKYIPIPDALLFNKNRLKTIDKFLQNPLVKQLFDIWRENVSGVHQLWRTDIREQTDFVEFIYERIEKARHPKYKDTFINYSETAFGLGMLRPNSQVHIYLTYSFLQRPIKELIADYLDMAIIAGRYDLLLKRYPPYHSLLKLFTKHGERTPFDSRRGIDFRPLTYRLDTKFTTPIKLRDVQTRQNDRYISCPVFDDPVAEAEKAAEIEALENRIRNDAPHYGYFSNVELGSDGQFYNKETNEVVPVYGMKRAGFIQSEDQLKFLKAIPRPGPKSGLIIRFNLLDPVFVMTEGIHRSRDISFDDIQLVLKILDVCQRGTRGLVGKALKEFENKAKEPGGNGKEPEFNNIFGKKLDEVVDGAIDKIFDDPAYDDLSPQTLEFLHNLEKFKEESDSLSSSWKYLTSKLVEGKSNDLLIAICQRLMDEGFDITFSILPLLMPTEIAQRKIEEIKVAIVSDGNAQEGEQSKVAAAQKEGNRPRAESDSGTEKRTLLPLIELLKREIEDLLKKVFSSCIDISAATRRARSEPAIAQMIVYHCINVQSDRQGFRNQLEKKLREHYAIHRKFLKEFYAMDDSMVTPVFENFQKVDSDTVLKDIHGLDDRVFEERIKKDVDGIVSLIDQTRLRLYSPSENNRLLCFIDPDSVEVQIGDFEYAGAPLENEEEFLEQREAYQIGLAEEIRLQYFEAQKKKAIEEASVQHKRAEVAAAGMKKRIEIKTYQLMEEHQVKQALMKANISEAEIGRAIQEVKLKAYEALKNGELKEYAISALVEAHHDGGVEQVTDILRRSPKAYLAAMDSGLFELQETAGFKEKLLEIAEGDQNRIDPITMAMIFNNDFKDVVGSYIHKEINNILSGFFKNFRRNIRL